jgi:hypothetical protein
MSRWGKEGVVHTTPEGFHIGDREFLNRLANA